MIKFQQSKALTSHIESFWSIVHWKPSWVPLLVLDFYKYNLRERNCWTQTFARLVNLIWCKKKGRKKEKTTKIENWRKVISNWGCAQNPITQFFLRSSQSPLLEFYEIMQIFQALKRIGMLINSFARRGTL